MIRFQIIERTGANLHKTLVDAMRAGCALSRQLGAAAGFSTKTCRIRAG